MDASNPQTRPSMASIAITQAIAVVVFVLVPIVITLMVPFTDLEFRKSGTNVSITVHRYVLMAIPWRTRQIDNVERLRADITAERNARGVVVGSDGVTSVSVTRFSTGQIAITGNGGETFVQAAPDLARSTVSQFERFRARPDAAPLRVSLYASWWLSWVLGGVVTFLCAFYLFGASVALLRWIFSRGTPHP